MVLGRLATSEQPFKGQLAEVRVWDHALPESDIKARMRVRVSSAARGLLRCWPLAEKTTVSAAASLAPSVTTPELCAAAAPGTVRGALFRGSQREGEEPARGFFIAALVAAGRRDGNGDRPQRG
ncbi:MAG TPA: hypothetical protein VM686_25845, partial [Polyangiaceae bacterium]|nr:hypothetical protein [Polyangiaceae bacterium]